MPRNFVARVWNRINTVQPIILKFICGICVILLSFKIKYPSNLVRYLVGHMHGGAPSTVVYY
jgi:hypothetical protein